MLKINLQLFAHKKGVGSTSNGRDSESKRLGVKRSDGQYVNAGEILIRQRGTLFVSGPNTYLGKDHTVHAAVSGLVAFKTVATRRGKSRKQVRISEISRLEEQKKAKKKATESAVVA